MKCQPRSGGIFRKSKKAVEKAHGVCGLEGKKVETNKEQNYSIFAQFFRFRGSDREIVKIGALRTDLVI